MPTWRPWSRWHHPKCETAGVCIPQCTLGHTHSLAPCSIHETARVLGAQTLGVASSIPTPSPCLESETAQQPSGTGVYLSPSIPSLPWYYCSTTPRFFVWGNAMSSCRTRTGAFSTVPISFSCTLWRIVICNILILREAWNRNTSPGLQPSTMCCTPRTLRQHNACSQQHIKHTSKFTWQRCTVCKHAGVQVVLVGSRSPTGSPCRWPHPHPKRTWVGLNLPPTLPLIPNMSAWAGSSPLILTLTSNGSTQGFPCCHTPLSSQTQDGELLFLHRWPLSSHVWSKGGVLSCFQKQDGGGNSYFLLANPCLLPQTRSVPSRPFPGAMGSSTSASAVVTPWSH